MRKRLFISAVSLLLTRNASDAGEKGSAYLTALYRKHQIQLGSRLSEEDYGEQEYMAGRFFLRTVSAEILYEPDT